ncbi:hypothetical protein HN587_07580 [Candidatus Woesearchaeota archaeon]|jgi:hypothetical protein|nr:hypothetical protein [Candidatus Woesearchaeota archaeon]
MGKLYQLRTAKEDPVKALYKKPEYVAPKAEADQTYESDVGSIIETAVNKVIPFPFQEPKAVLAKGLEDVAYESAKGKPYTLDTARQRFENYFFKDQLRDNYGNISQVARQTGVNRRTIHRKVKEHGLEGFVDAYRPQKDDELNLESQTKSLFDEQKVASALKQTLGDYKGSLHPNVYSPIEQNVSGLAKQLTTELNGQNYGITRDEKISSIYSGIQTADFKEAKNQFEKEFIYGTLAETGFDKQKTAEYLDIDLRSLNRKISDLGIPTSEEEAHTQLQEVNQALVMYYSNKDQTSEEEASTRNPNNKPSITNSTKDTGNTQVINLDSKRSDLNSKPQKPKTEIERLQELILKQEAA